MENITDASKAAPTQGASRSALSTLLVTELAQFPAKVGIFVKNLATGEEAGVAVDTAFDSESVIKVPIMVLAFQLAEAGDLDLDERYEIKRADLEPGSGIFQHHDLGARPTHRDLITEMIITSDNSATRILVKKLGGVERINAWLDDNGYRQTRAGPIEQGWRPTLALVDPIFSTITVEEAHGLFYAAWGSRQFKLYESLFTGKKRAWLDRVSGEAIEAAFEVYADRPDLWYGTTTPREMGRIMEAIVQGTIASEESCASMQALLRNQQLGACRIPHFLEAPVAHKTGDLTPGVANDVGIIYSPSGLIVLSFFSTGIHEPYGEFEDRIGRLAQKVVAQFEAVDSR